MAFVKSFVRSIAPQSLIDEHAFKLLGEPPERAEKILAHIREQVADGMRASNPQPSPSMIFSMPIAFCELVRALAIELSKGGGCA